jgi:hypothetical protein
VPSGACATLQITAWSELKMVSIFGASDSRPSRLSEMPSKRPFTKSTYEFISQAVVPLENTAGTKPARITRLATLRARMERIIP